MPEAASYSYKFSESPGRFLKETPGGYKICKNDRSGKRASIQQPRVNCPGTLGETTRETAKIKIKVLDAKIWKEIRSNYQIQEDNS